MNFSQIKAPQSLLKKNEKDRLENCIGNLPPTSFGGGSLILRYAHFNCRKLERVYQSMCLIGDWVNLSETNIKPTSN